VQHVAELEATLLPLFQEEAEQVRREYPAFKFNVWSSSVGGATTYQGHDIGLECIFPDAADHEADCVAACVGVKHLTTEPMLSEVEVEWGSGNHPEVRLDLLEHAVPLTREALHNVVAQLPELFIAFRTALQAWASRSTRA